MRRSARLLTLVALSATAALAGGALAAPAPTTTSSGLPAVAAGHRPGPDVLYAPAPRAPQLESAGVWRAQPILVSGSTAYRDGEWLYQDFLYDDHGPTGTKDPEDPYGVGAHLYSPPAGTLTYPTDKRYVHNAADLVELRVKPLADATAFRVTLNSLVDPALSAFTIALGTGDSSVAWPYGAGVSSASSLFLTWHGRTATLLDAGLKPVSPAPGVRVDLLRRQVEVRVPHRAWDPKRSVVRTTIGVGLWDTAVGSYLQPAPGPATATTPGGGLPGGPALFNVGPREQEPLPLIAGATMADTAVGGLALAMFWRERQQSLELTARSVAPFAAEVDFGKLARKVRDDSRVPSTGHLDRIFASKYSFGQGLDPARVCFDLASGFEAGARCVGSFVGQLQPYALYVPAKARPARGFGLTLLLHSLSANYNQYLGTNNAAQLGDRGAGSIVLTPAGRGPDGFYAGVAEADSFEAWADVARHYRLDQGWTAVSGYSMGGFGTYRMLARWPDLFSRGFSVVGAPGSAVNQLVSLRNTPLLAWNAAGDELVNLQTSEDAVAALTAAGVPFEADLFLTADHLTLAANDEYGPGAAFLGNHRVLRDPSRISFVVDRSEDSRSVVSDHAYWLSGLTTRKGAVGTVEAGLTGRSVPACARVGPVVQGAGALVGGRLPALPFVSRSTPFGPAPCAGAAEALELKLTNLSAVTVDARRAHLRCGAPLRVTTDGPVTVTLAGCGVARRFG